MRNVFMFIFLMLFTACNKPARQAPRQIANGINGETVYIYNKEGRVTFVCKPDYYNDTYAVLINNDTLKLGENFRCTLGLGHEGSFFYIDEPTKDTLAGGDEYIFTPVSSGVLEFTGRIVYDTLEVPIRYKVFVKE